MSIKFIKGIKLLLFLICGCVCGSVEEDFLGIIPEGYRKMQLPRPKLDDTEFYFEEERAVAVEISYKITGIHDVDLREMTVRFGVFLRVSWRDHRLIWPFPGNLTDEGRSKLILDHKILDHIWIPDTYIEYSRNIEKFSMLQDVISVTMDRNGQMFVSAMMSITLSCSWNFIYYPFDVQKCDFVIASYHYTKKDINMKWSSLGVSASDTIESALTAYEFQLIPDTDGNCYCQSCMNEDFACRRSTLVFRRHYMAKLLAVYMPSGAMVFVSWLSFFWPPEVIPGRTVLVITSLLTLLSMDFSLRTIIPETGYMKAVDVWMFSCIFMVILSILQYGVIIRIRRFREEVRLSQVRPSASSIQQELSKLPLQLLNPNKHILNTTEKHTRRYLLMEMVVERSAIIFHPFIFFCINAVYWSYFLSAR